jgi:vancomycin resistance protein YoaR
MASESRTKLRSDDRAAEQFYQEGKVQNLRKAVERLDCSVVGAGQVFSFWKQIGRASTRRGYVTGRMLQQGCMIPAIGGGLCQLSNALYDVALQAGCEILERHAHSRAVSGSAGAVGRDATVAWNYVDLRFRSQIPALIRARVTDDELVIAFWVRPGTSVAPVVNSERHATVKSGNSQRADEASTCATCAEVDCFRRESQEQNREG